MFGSSGSQRWSESKDAQMDDFNTDLFSFINSMQGEGTSDGLDGGGTALTVSEAEIPPVSVAGVQKSLFRYAWCEAMDAELELWTDSNYAEKADDRRSVLGIAIMLCHAVVCWASSTQKVIAVSTSEAEYISIGDGVKEALFTKRVLSLFVPEMWEECFDVFVDNARAPPCSHEC